MGKRTKKKNKSNVEKKNYGYYLRRIGSALMWLILSAYFIVLPFYFVNGYEMIATNKYRCFMAISKCSVIAILIYLVILVATWGVKKEELKIYKPLFKIDIAVLSFMLFVFISYVLSNYKQTSDYLWDGFFEGAYYGISGWFMGVVTYFILVVMYFAISRLFIYNDKFWIPVLLLDSLIFIWALLNRYQIYPIKMEYATEWFLASIGQINWLAGFASIIVPVLYGLYWSESRPKKRRFFIPVLVAANLCVLVNGSESSMMSFAFMCFLLIVVSLSDETKMLRFSELMLMFSLCGVVILILDTLFPGVKNFESVLADFFVKGWTPFVWVVLFGGMYAYFKMCTLGKLNYSDKAKKVLPKLVLILGLSAVVIVILLVIINTKLRLETGEGLPIIGKNKYFYFNKKWGTSRGTTMRAGVYTFFGLSLREKLFGSGPDTFYYSMLQNEAAMKIVTKRFEDMRLTNAHCELLTLLVNIGICGTASFIGMCVVSIKEFLGRVKKTPQMIIFALVIVMYLSNNLVSFEQIVNLPLFFLTIGIGASAIVAYDIRKAP